MATVLEAVSTQVWSDCHGLASKSSIEVVNNSLSFTDSWSADSYYFLACAYVSCSNLDSEFCDCEKVSYDKPFSTRRFNDMMVHTHV